MTDYLDLPIGNESPEIVTAVIEIPQGCINKYEYDKSSMFSVWMVEDGDPLDILVLGDAPTFPGCIYLAHPSGLFEMLECFTFPCRVQRR